MLRSKLFDGLKRISDPFRTRNHHRDGARRGRGFRRLGLECLERRELLSVAGWVASATGPEHVGAVDLATDLEGNVYVTGDFRGTVDFAPGVTIPGDPDILTSSGGSESFAAKYGPDGSLDWVRGLGAIDGGDWGKGIAVEAVGDETVADNVYIVAADGDQWKLNGDDGSTIRWDEDNSSLELRDVAVDPATGDVYFTGSFSGTITTNDTVSTEPITLTSEGYDDVFVAKANSDGQFYWVQQEGARRTSSGGDSINLDASGNVYVTGNLNDRKGSDTRGQSDIFVWKLDPTDGSFVWTQRAGGDGGNVIQYGGDAGYEIAVDNSGDVYVTGALAPSDSPADFGDFQIDLSSHVGSYNFGFVTKLDDATGDFLWATSFGGSGTIGGSLDFDSTGKLHLGGRAETAGTFGTLALGDRSGPSIGFLATMNAGTGQFESVQRVGTSGDPGADMLAFDPNDNLFMAGWLNGVDQEFLTGDVLSSTLYDMVLVKLLAADPTNTPPVAGNDSFSTPEDAPLTIPTADLLANDSDADEDPVTIQSFGSPGHGTLLDNQDGTITYTPDADFNGTDGFTYTIRDGRGGQDTATVTVDVTPVDDAPIADAGGPYTVPEGGTATLDASGSTDPDLPYGDTLTYAWDFNNDGMFIDATGVAPTFDAAGLGEGAVVPIAVQVTDSTSNVSTAATTVTVAAVPSELTFDYLGGPKTIGDNKIVTTTIDISGTGVSIADLTIQLNLTHASPGDLAAWLIAPDGTTTFTLGTAILDGIHDYAVPGATGMDLDGVWTLKVEDSEKNRKRGTLFGWSMVVEPAPIESAQSQAAAVDQALLTWLQPDSSDDDDTDPLTESLVDDLVLMLVE